MSRWWTWDWDECDYAGVEVPRVYSRIRRWRRGWVTLYAMTYAHSGHGIAEVTDWRLFLTFNINIGMSR